MAKYRVWAKMSTYCYLDVQAGSEAEAERIALDADGGDFITGDDGDWEILDNTEALEENGHINYKVMTDEELDEMYINIIDEREGVKDGSEKAEHLDELYLEVSKEIQERKAKGSWTL